jgi:flagellar biosynthesis/type III secretory pathway protein FliH
LRKIIKSSNTEQVNTFRLHYFPNIPMPHNGDDGSEQENTAGGKTLQGNRSLTVEDQLRLKEEEIERKAYDNGFRKGEEEGRMASEKKAASLLTALQTTLSELDGIRGRLRQQLEREVVELALHVARKVIHHEISLSGDALLCVVKEAMGHLDDPGEIAIRLNPDDLRRLRETGERLHDAFENLENIHFEEDPGITCGGCYIHTEYGEIDARLEEQLRHIEEAFRAEMRNSMVENG